MRRPIDEKKLRREILSRESKKAQSLLDRGGTFTLIAENVALYYRALCNSSFGQSLSEDEKLFAVAVMDCWPYIWQDKLPIEIIQHSIPMIKIGMIGTTPYWVPHSDDIWNLKGENSVLISLIMQIEVMIFCAEMLANYREIVSMVIEMEPLISEMASCVLHEGDNYELYTFIISYVESFIQNPEFQTIMRNFRQKKPDFDDYLPKDENLSSEKENLLFTNENLEYKKQKMFDEALELKRCGAFDDLSEIEFKKKMQRDERLIANRNLQLLQISVILLLIIFCGLSTFFFGKYVFGREVVGLNAVCYTSDSIVKSDYYHDQNCKYYYHMKDGRKTTVYEARKNGYFDCPYCDVSKQNEVSVKCEYGYSFLASLAISISAYICFYIFYVKKKKTDRG